MSFPLHPPILKEMQRARKQGRLTRKDKATPLLPGEIGSGAKAGSGKPFDGCSLNRIPYKIRFLRVWPFECGRFKCSKGNPSIVFSRFLFDITEPTGKGKGKGRIKSDQEYNGEFHEQEGDDPSDHSVEGHITDSTSGE